VPVEIPAGTRIAAVQLGCGFALALTSTGGILAWGTNNSGTLGSGSSAQRSLVPVPVKLPAGVTVKAISAGDDFSLALTTGSRVLAWGSDLVGELGDGRHHDHSSVPVPVKLAAGIKGNGAGHR
jgi:alpha-tubulin suppressor-like RCC1 family protein